MKATELMIGDWVYDAILKCNTQVEMLSLSGIRGDCHENIWNENTFEPIPLTSEILEKNGFEIQDQGGGRKDVWIGFGADCEGDIEVEFQNNIPVHLKIDGGFKGEYYISANIKYVHELQRAFRLLKTNKDIVL